MTKPPITFARRIDPVESSAAWTNNSRLSSRSVEPAGACVADALPNIVESAADPARALRYRLSRSVICKSLANILSKSLELRKGRGRPFSRHHFLKSLSAASCVSSASRSGGRVREIDQRRLSHIKVPPNFLYRAAGITPRRRAQSLPEYSDQEVAIIQNSFIDKLLRSLAKFGRSVSIPAYR